MASINRHPRYHWLTLPTLCFTIIQPLNAYATDALPAMGTLSYAKNKAPQDSTPAYILNTEVVKASPEAIQQATIEHAFLPDHASVGMLGRQRLQDTPFSVNVLNHKLFSTLGLRDTADALKYFPSTQMEFRDGNGTGRPQSRGFEGGVIENMHEDGFNIVATTPIPMEMYDHMEIINGLTGPQYGAANPAGDFDYYTKRPTRTYQNTYATSVTNHGRIMNSLDLGGSPSRYFGYRINLLHEEGKAWAQDSHLYRTLGSLDIDIHPTSSTTIQLHDSMYRWEGHGFPGGFQNYVEYGLPSALDARRRGYGQKYAGSNMRTNTQSFKVLQNLGNDWQLTFGLLHQNAFRQTHNITNVMLSPTEYEQKYTRINATAWKFDVLSNLATLAGNFHTGTLKHHVTFATNGFRWSTLNGNNSAFQGVSANPVIGTAPLNHPKAFHKPDTPSLPHYKSSTVRQQNVMIGDAIDFNRHFTLQLDGSHNFFHYKAWNKKGERTSGGSDGGNSATAAFLYKPTQQLTTYPAYASSLQIGGMAPSGAKNEFQLLSPIRSKQWELGLKSRISDRIDVNAAVFRITRPLAFVGNDGHYRNEGKQRNYGAELWATGNPIQHLHIMGGVTWLNAKLLNAYDQSTSGKNVVGVPHYQANMLVEYQLPQLENLTLLSNLHYVGKRAADPTNHTWAGRYATVDIGARYDEPNVYGHRLSVSLMIENLTNRKYWAGVFPSSIYGNTGSNYTAYLGAPRTATLSASVSF